MLGLVSIRYVKSRAWYAVLIVGGDWQARRGTSYIRPKIKKWPSMYAEASYPRPGPPGHISQTCSPLVGGDPAADRPAVGKDRSAAYAVDLWAAPTGDR